MLSERLKDLRNSRKIRQEDIAKKLGIARTTYASYEQGFREPDNEMLQKIAVYFNVTIDFLLGRTDVASPVVISETPSSIKSWTRMGNPDLSEKEKDELAEDLEKYYQFRKQRILKERENK